MFRLISGKYRKNGGVRLKVRKNSKQFTSFFANETNIGQEELKELRDIVDIKIASKKTKNIMIMKREFMIRQIK
jgi:hypothetical protein